jgi:FMN phosphatase YigB (HAD superfamily)
VDTVRAIRRAGVPVGVVSSAVYHPFLEWTLTAFGIRDQIEAVVTSASAGFYKSRPELYWQAAASLGVAPAHIVHVGDSLRFDVGGASRAGMGTVWLQPNGAPSGGHGFVPDLTVHSLADAAPEILNLLRSRVDQTDLARGRA